MTQKQKLAAFVAGNFIQATCWHMLQLPQCGESCQALQVYTEAGGKGLNVAIGLARLNQQVSPLIGCGRDAASEGLFQLLRHEGIDQRFVYQFEHADSGQGGGFIDQQGNNMIAVALGANLLLNKEHALQCSKTIAAAGLVYGQFETAIDALQQTFVLARQYGVPALLNPSPWQQPTTAIQNSTHTLLVNEVEIQCLIPALQNEWQSVKAHQHIALQQRQQQYAHLIQRHLAGLFAVWTNLNCLIVTLGSAGCLAFKKDAESSLQCWAVEACSVQAVDSVGAGDAFAAGYCSALLDHLAFTRALQQASACGAYMVSQRGVLAALPTTEQLQQFMQHTRLPPVHQIRL